jgi:anti-anti-sigma factor
VRTRFDLEAPEQPEVWPPTGDEAVDMDGMTNGFIDVLTEAVVEGTINDGQRLVVDVRAVGAGDMTLRLRGELDVAETERLYQLARQAIDQTGQTVVLDLSGLTFCDGSGLGCLVRIGNHADTAGRRLLLASPTPIVAKVLRIGRLDRRFAIVPGSADIAPVERAAHATVTG